MSTPYKVLICGDREWTDREMIKSILESFPRDTVIIHGDARGADRMARDVARELGFSGIVPFPANWTKYKKAAGPIRNQQMLDEGKPDMVYAFHNDIAHSKGTKDMIARAVKHHKRTELYSRGGRRIIHAPDSAQKK